MARVAAVGAWVATALVLVLPLPAHAAPSPSPPAGSASPGSGIPVCNITDNRLFELSGLVAVEGGYVTANDSNSGAKHVFFLDNACKIRRNPINYPRNPLDPEDIAVGTDNVVWVADTGDNGLERATVALWKLDPNSTTPVIYRLTYPDGKHDAEALLLAADNTPIIVTKGVKAGVYVPTGPLVANSQQGVALKKVGEVPIPPTETSNPLAVAGRIAVTGGAQPRDRKRVALRTYADAFEWDVPDGDVVKAITTGKPRITPLPDEPWGESITYSLDGKSFVTVSDLEAGKQTRLLRYTPAVAALPSPKQQAADPAEDSPGLFDRKLSLQDITYLVAGVGIIGLVLVVVGVLAIRKSRAERRGAGVGAPVRGSAAARGRPGRGAPDDDDPYDDDRYDDDYHNPPTSPPTGPVGSARASARPPARGGAGAVYGSRAAAAPPDDPYDDYGGGQGRGRTGNVYGGGRYTGQE